MSVSQQSEVKCGSHNVGTRPQDNRGHPSGGWECARGIWRAAEGTQAKGGVADVPMLYPGRRRVQQM